MNLKKMKLYFNCFRVIVALGILLTAVSVAASVAGKTLEKNAYSGYVAISAATDAETRRIAYQKAIRLNPSRPEAYILLLDVYNEDGIFSQKESEEFLGVYNGNHNRLDVKDEAYSQLQYKAGMLYVNGYEGNTATRLRMALPFLETAKDMGPEDPNYMTALCYCQIGAFYRDYIWDASAIGREVPPGEMTALLTDISTTFTALQESMQPDAVYNRLGFCIAVGNLLYDQRNILAATVPEKIVTSILDAMYTDLPAMEELQKEQTKNLLNTLLQNEETYRDMVARAYERKVG